MRTRIVLRRDSGFMDFTRRYKVVIDGEEAGTIGNGGRFETEVEAGAHTLQLRIDWCSSNLLEFFAPEGGQLGLECGSNLRGRHIWKASRLLDEAPEAWIWLRLAA
ncbi:MULTISPECIES: hypothetical protein [unclassified Variovorax]|jgi:hypothetical protein|uniref:hypothetical protein n=1 Tax=unclassified Variovorax TaxID=663243 RepID=UPI0008DFB8CB|nr:MULTISPECIES: hypothetical protein [unclassified Variovorax]TAJ63611.1 MAG: hypothetical protein EPO53_14870 [Variovorax sp.]SFP83096.1 hypothetical protein SAMN05443579_11623 [Variovorax sp. PDC80]